MQDDTLKCCGVTITCTGGFLVLADEICAVNDPEFWTATLSTHERASRLRDLRDRGELFEWNPVLDGTFRLEVSIGRGLDFLVGANAKKLPFALQLSTGRLTVRSATETRPALVVEAGLYEGVLVWDYNEESAHSSVESASEYPRNEGPDGRVALRLLQSFGDRRTTERP
jgi:hypothetical protein